MGAPEPWELLSGLLQCSRPQDHQVQDETMCTQLSSLRGSVGVQEASGHLPAVQPAHLLGVPPAGACQLSPDHDVTASCPRARTDGSPACHLARTRHLACTVPPSGSQLAAHCHLAYPEYQHISCSALLVVHSIRLYSTRLVSSLCLLCFTPHHEPRPVAVTSLGVSPRPFDLNRLWAPTPRTAPSDRSRHLTAWSPARS